MLHELPITNVRLLACHEDWQRMTPTEQGRHCRSCNRVVIDFTQASAAELKQARAAAPDGRVCGRFAARQVDPATRQTRLRPRLRWFLAAVVLVLVQGFSAQQAWAQLQPAAPHVCPPVHSGFVGIHESDIPTGGMRYKSGRQEEFERIVSDRLQWPLNAQGRPAGSWRRSLWVICAVDTTGQVYASQIKGRRPLPRQQPFLDELNRVLAQLPHPFEPPTHHGRPISAATLLRFTFTRPRS